MIKRKVLADHEAVSQAATDWLCDVLRSRPAALLCLAAGSTPMRAYELLAERGRAEERLTSRMRVIKLDEWGGLPMNDPATCEESLQMTLIRPLKLGDRYVAFNSRPSNPAAEAQRIGDWLTSHGPIDSCVLGLGLNGHVGFNEPAEFLQPHAHVASLSATSLAHSMIHHATVKPQYGLTLGMADLLQSRRLLIVVTGAAKREPLSKLFSQGMRTTFPASLLHLHPDATLFCDSAAMAE
jgi:galactosamine-6-phosphate isomerase